MVNDNTTLFATKRLKGVVPIGVQKILEYKNTGTRKIK